MVSTLEFPHIFSPIFMHSFTICWVYMGLFEAAFVEGISIRRKFQDKWEARQQKPRTPLSSRVATRIS